MKANILFVFRCFPSLALVSVPLFNFNFCDGTGNGKNTFPKKIRLNISTVVDESLMRRWKKSDHIELERTDVKWDSKQNVRKKNTRNENRTKATELHFLIEKFSVFRVVRLHFYFLFVLFEVYFAKPSTWFNRLLWFPFSVSTFHHSSS